MAKYIRTEEGYKNINDLLTINKPDWNESDPESSGYINNRTHYVTLNELIASETFNCNLDPYYHGNDWRRANILYGITLEDNCYCWIYDGVPYIFYNGDSFRINGLFDAIKSDNYFYFEASVPGYHTLEIYTCTIKTLDENFIPDTIARTSDLIGQKGEGDYAEIFNATWGNKASGNWSHAEGYSTEASGNSSHAEGRLSIAAGNYSHAEGQESIASGDSSHAEGRLTEASGDYSHAEGFSTEALSNYSHAEGEQSKASGYGSHAEGNSIASGDYSHAEGYLTKASISHSHAEGQESIASGNNSHAEGYLTKASGSNSHAEGRESIASGENSHAEGRLSTAAGNYSHTEGYGTTARNRSTHVEGEYNIPEDVYSFGEGRNSTISLKKNSFIDLYKNVIVDENNNISLDNSINTVIEDNTLGDSDRIDYYFRLGYCYMILPDDGAPAEINGWWDGSTGYKTISVETLVVRRPEIRGKYVHVVGNGNASTRSNAHTLDWNGNAWYQGDVYVGGEDQDNGAKKLATEEFVNNTIEDIVEASSTQADMSETDDTSASYIKNKTHYYWDGLGIDRMDSFTVGWNKWQDMSDATSTILNQMTYDVQTTASTGPLVLKFGANALGTTQIKEVWLKDVAGIRYEKIDNVNSRYKVNNLIYVYFISDLTALTEEYKNIFDTVGLYVNIANETGVSGLAFLEIYLYNIVKLRSEFLPEEVAKVSDIEKTISEVIDPHIANTDVHITTTERGIWNQVSQKTQVQFITWEEND